MAAPIYTGGLPFLKGGFRGKNKVTASASATVTLVPSQSNGTFLFDRTTGGSFTLPTPTAGLVFNFIVTATQASGANVVVTSAAGIYLLGAIIMFSGVDITPSATLGPKCFAGNGSSHIKVTTNGTTLGGAIGSWMRFHCLSATQWAVTGVLDSPSGTLATPFST